MRIAELKRMVAELGLDCTACAEKADFIRVIQDHRKAMGAKQEL